MKIEFEIKDLVPGAPTLKKIGYGTNEKQDDTTYVQICTLKIGIKGIPLEIGFTNDDSFLAEYPSTGMDATEIRDHVKKQCDGYIDQKYPSIIL